MDVDKNTDKISLSNIVDYILEEGENIDFSNIEYLISERCSLDGYPNKSFHEFILWKDLKDIVQSNDKISLKIRKQISDYYNNLNKPIWPNKSINTIADIESVPIPNLKTQTANFLLLNELGIIDFLKDKYPDVLKNDNDIGKLLCQIMRYEAESEIKSMRTLVRDLRNKPNEIKTDKAMNEVFQILIQHKLRELK